MTHPEHTDDPFGAAAAAADRQEIVNAMGDLGAGMARMWLELREGGVGKNEATEITAAYANGLAMQPSTEPYVINEEPL